MSNDDVIELGSSDEDSEPTPKKSKLTPNLRIPRKLHEVTIKPTKSNSISLKPNISSVPKGTLIKPIYPVIKTKLVSQNGSKIMTIQPATKAKIALNPCSNFQTPSYIHSKCIKTKDAALKKIKNKPALGQCVRVTENPIKEKSLNLINLPPSITVKKTVSNRPILLLNVKSKDKINQKANTEGDVLTVELDDEEATHNSSPQWYLRPEEQTEIPIETENNKEPDETKKLIEITIEDSPVKPVHKSRTYEVGAELAITIDDSPVKAVAPEKNDVASESDNDGGKGRNRTPHSKKRLQYPKEVERRTVEIEIDPAVISASVDDNPAVIDVIKKQEETVVNTESNSKLTTPKDTKSEAQISEFHPTYQSFINLCFELENSSDMKQIVEKKIKGYYRQVPKEYTESEEFIDMVSSKILSMKASPEKMYLFIKDIVDELNMQRKLAKAQPPVAEKCNAKKEDQPDTNIADNKYDSKRQRQIRKLEKTIKKLHRTIQKLEEQEVDFDDDDDSVYLLTERYKERMVRVYAKFCQLSNTKMPSEPRIQIDARPGRPSGPAKRLEKWINKKVPIGTPLPFPDFHDVLRCVREANAADNLNFNEADIMEEARDLFTRCGKKLQRRRQENEWRLAASRIAVHVDPAENNEDLRQKLNENRKIAANKETEIFNKFADKQNLLKLEAKEIGDKEAEESPVESDEEETNEESASLENTEKKKDRENTSKGKEDSNTSGTFEKPTKLNTDKESEREQKGDINDNSKKKHENNEDNEDKLDEKEETEKVKKNTNDGHKTSQDTSNNLILSDNSNDLESDIDELHLLQKFDSRNEEQSSTNSSDSDSLIAISDSLESSEENIKQETGTDDVISIENSSYSEDETDIIDNTQLSNTDSVEYIDDSPTTDANVRTTPNMELELPSAEFADTSAQINNDECDGAVEDILLASSEDDNSQNAIQNECVNLRDDFISIEETIIGETNKDCHIHVEKQLSQEKNSENICVDANTVSNASLEKNNETESELNKEDSLQDSGNKDCGKKLNITVEKMDVDIDIVMNQTKQTINSEAKVPSQYLKTL